MFDLEFTQNTSSDESFSWLKEFLSEEGKADEETEKKWSGQCDSKERGSGQSDVLMGQVR